MAVNTTDVPDRYDLVIQLNNGNTYGFLLSDALESNLPFRTHKALYSYSPTFLERQNLSNSYGDNFQDFFLTGSQDDFSVGEGQKFFRVNDAERSRRYFAGSNIEPTVVPGNVTLTYASTAVSGATPAGAVTPSNAALNHGVGVGVGWWQTNGSSLWSIGASTASCSLAATIGGFTGVGASGVCTDNQLVYVSHEANLAGTGGIATWNGSASGAFSTTAVSQMVFLNNILFGFSRDQDTLYSFDASGNATSQFQWKDANGTVASVSKPFMGMVPYGGQIYILRQFTNLELWVYDGSGVRKLQDFPVDFVSGGGSPGFSAFSNICVSEGILFVSGWKVESALNSTAQYRQQIYYYANGSLGKLYEAPTYSSIANYGAVAPYGDGIAFVESATQTIQKYDLASGGRHTIFNVGNQPGIWSNSNTSSLYMTTPGQAIYGYPSASFASSGYIQTSQYDFDNTLAKVIRSIKIDADIPAQTSIDLAYQLDGCGGTYTTLQTSASSGVEYFLPITTTAHSISIQVTLKSATGAATPTLKRVYVRAAPTLQQYRRREYILDLSGGYRSEKGKVSRVCRDGTPYPKAGIDAANDLITIATQTIPFTCYDRFSTGGFTALADLQQNIAGFDGFAIYEIHPGVYLARLNVREV